MKIKIAPKYRLSGRRNQVYRFYSADYDQPLSEADLNVEIHAKNLYEACVKYLKEIFGEYTGRYKNKDEQTFYRAWARRLNTWEDDPSIEEIVQHSMATLKRDYRVDAGEGIPDSPKLQEYLLSDTGLPMLLTHPEYDDTVVSYN